MITIVVLPVWAAARNAVRLQRGGRRGVAARGHKQPDWLAEPASCRGFNLARCRKKHNESR